MMRWLSYLVTTSEELAKKVSEEVDGFVKVLSRKEIIQKSADHTVIYLWQDRKKQLIRQTR